MPPLRQTFGAIAFCGAGAAALAAHPDARQWARFADTGWQIAGPAGEEPSATDARERTRGACPEGMVAVAGRALGVGDDSVERLQDAACVDWQQKAFPGRCLRFDPDRLGKLLATVPAQTLRFCMDRFEYPDRQGAYPVVAITFRESGALCARAGKRLCTEDEWTFACEGAEALPYPYGYTRDDTACVIDRPNPAYDSGALSRRDRAEYAQELERLWRGEASGARARCKSAFGVYDLTGNVDEWTTSTRTGGVRSIMKGGYWGRVRTRCRPSTRAHGEDFAFYQQGFRCCAPLT